MGARTEDLSVREASVERYLLLQMAKRVRPLYPFKVKKVEGWRGWPDRLFLFKTQSHAYEGIAHFVEAKRPRGGKFEPLQVRTMAELIDYGFCVWVIRNRAAVDLYIDTLLRNGPHNMPGNFDPKNPTANL